MIVDLRSDTVTQPTLAMKTAMFEAPLGDDVFGDDPSVNELERFSAALFGMEAAVYCPSGTMTNQIAIKINSNAPGEIICDQLAHIYKYEGGGIGFNAGLASHLLAGDKGRLSAEQIEAAIQPDDPHFPETQVVSLENTCNKGGGSIYDLEEIKKISTLCKNRGLKLHLDGARVFNAIVEADYGAKDLGAQFDTISVCLSKGLGAPVGSVLLGSQRAIKKARRIRKLFGGGMRQAGILAAAGTFALKNNIERLKEDHAKAKILGNTLENCSYVKRVLPVYTNIVVFEVQDHLSHTAIIEQLNQEQIKTVAFGPQQIRLVTHLNFTEKMLEKTITVLDKLK
ncbi:threonine aldolase family protein [Aureispira anguillae]|uniref:Aminotransferase class I/II-fold pyridoxal phosphate-dependent enzyme n=1 Tax=Aureispira anguillae TaxID=2864201 RepID=A0A915YDL5_9BACT|nr:GntG family PLP-dependent aldolase [Aureispira anguillae]BDS11103.1 aminotransferase class I/II-fold pyridoxal phosphate-dependent enzyme [Aureispira anguillae]